MQKHRMIAALAGPPALLLAWAALRPGVPAVAQEPAAPPAASGAKAADRAATAWTTAVEPKPLSKSVKKGLDWLVEHQLPGGGWGQGEESLHMRGGGRPDSLKDTPDVADTCIAALALIRSGSTPREGLYRDAVAKAVRYVRSQVESSDSQSLSVTSVQGTRVQQKLGPNIDTFLASMLLAEAKGRMPDADSEKGVDLALAKVLDKIQKHQKADGSFEGGGWAPVLAQAMCGKGINRARQAGAAVPQVALARAELGAVTSFNGAASPIMMAGAAPAASTYASSGPRLTRSIGGGVSGKGAADLSAPTAAAGFVPAAPRGDAGVELYSRAASLGVLQDSVNTNQAQVAGLRDQAANAKEESKRSDAKKKLAEIDKLATVQAAARSAVVGRLEDKQFVSGFGSNGGEEFLSYMTIAESLVVKGGDEWKKWDAKMTENLDRVQDGDGSWSGHHCITGRTFCTSAALLVLMADRTPVPVAAKEGDKPTAQ
jgi:hypothetical protein